MKKDYKYFYETNTVRDWSCVKKWNGTYIVEVKEDVEYEQYIDLSFSKFPNAFFPRPKTSKFEKIRAILKEIFLDHYNLALKLLNKDISETGEFYLLQQSKDWYYIYYFSDDNAMKKSISIDFRNFMDYMYLTIHGEPNFRSRKGARNNGTAITYTHFMQIFRLILKFLYDSDSYDIYQDDFTKNFFLLVQSDEYEDIPDLMFSTDESFKEILERISRRKRKIEKRLIEKDDDTELDRARLRGEIDGLHYALKTISANK